MAMFPGDVIIKTAIELGLDDLRKNPWVIEDIFSDFIENPLLRDKYGMKEIDAAKKFIANNKIHIFMGHRMDKEEFPCITISMGDSDEDKTLATLGDQDIDSREYEPEEIGKPIPWIIKPFEIVSYNQETGEVKIPKNDNFKYLNAGMILVDTATGNGWIIRGTKAGNKIMIDPGSDLDGQKFGIAPKYATYKAKRERIISQEQYNIGCHAHGQESSLIFLFAFVKYSILRYREGLLENNNFQNSTIKCTDLVKNNSFQAENIWSRFVILTGQAEESWVKTPMRTIEAVDFSDGDGEDQVTGIQIMSNLDGEEEDNDLWITIEES